MEIQTVACLLKMRSRQENQEFDTQIYRAAADELVPVTELALHQAQHGLDAVAMVKPMGSYETTKGDEFRRLQEKYRPQVLALCFPSAAVPFPRTVDDLELTAEQMDTRKARVPEPEVAPPVVLDNPKGKAA